MCRQMSLLLAIRMLRAKPKCAGPARGHVCVLQMRCLTGEQLQLSRGLMQNILRAISSIAMCLLSTKNYAPVQGSAVLASEG